MLFRRTARATVRVAVAAAICGACEPALVPAALPPLLPPPPAPKPGAAPPAPLRIVPGETAAWDVRSRGVSIGRARWEVSPRDDSGHVSVTSSFRTHSFLSVAGAASASLTTEIDVSRRAPVRSDEEVDTAARSLAITTLFERNRAVVHVRRDGTPEQHEHPIPAGAGVHTLHTLLAALRARGEDIGRTRALAIVGGDLYDVDIAASGREPLGRLGVATRLDARLSPRTRPPLVANAHEIRITVWLRATAPRVPVRIDVDSGDQRVRAQLIESE